jgi:hypothetical protein
MENKSRSRNFEKIHSNASVIASIDGSVIVSVIANVKRQRNRWRLSQKTSPKSRLILMGG